MFTLFLTCWLTVSNYSTHVSLLSVIEVYQIVYLGNEKSNGISFCTDLPKDAIYMGKVVREFGLRYSMNKP